MISCARWSGRSSFVAHRDTRWATNELRQLLAGLATSASRAVEEVVGGGRGVVAAHGTARERQGGVETVNPTALAQHAAVRLVAVDHGCVHVHGAVEGVDPTAL